MRIIQVNSNAAGAGSAVSKGRLYSADYSPETGKYEIAVEYERDYDVEFVAGVQISIFTRTEYGGIEKYIVEETLGGATSPLKHREGSQTKSKSNIEFDNPNESYDIGLEIRTNATAWGAGSLGAAYNSKSLPPGLGPRHHVKVNDLRIRKEEF